MDAERNSPWYGDDNDVDDHILGRYEEDEAAVFFLTQDLGIEQDGRPEGSVS